MVDIGNFNADAEENQQGRTPFDVLPAGEYVVVLDSGERKDLKKNPGWRLALEFSVIEGEFEGRKLFHSCNLGYEVPREPGEAQKKAQTTLNIARAECGALVKACGKIEVSDTATLENIPLRVVVGVRPPSGNYGEQNEIKKFLPRDGGGSTMTASSSTPATPKKPGAAPWRK